MIAKVSAQVRFAYALPALALAVVGIPVYVYLPKFYTDVVGLQASTVGMVLLAVRIFDALSDPACGWLSDRTRTSLGRRRPYLILGSVPLAGALWLLLNPPRWTTEALGWWFAVGVFLLFLFWTLVEVPYEALGPEITFDYDERTRVLGTRDGFVIAGTLLAAGFPAALGALLQLPATAAGETVKFTWMAVVYAPFLVVACGICARWVPERNSSQMAERFNFREDLRVALSNRPFLVLLAAYTVSAVGSNLPATLILYYVQYVLHSFRADLFLMIYFVTGILFLPAWIALARRWGKKEAWLVSMAINTGAFAGVFFLGPGDEWTYGALVVASGIGFGGSFALPSALQADVIDYHEWLTGRRREGHYIGIWSVAKKLAAALGVGSALWVLGRTGYQPNVVQSESVVLSLRLLYALIPSLCNAAALILALRYPIDRQAHHRLMAAIAARKAGQILPDDSLPDFW